MKVFLEPTGLHSRAMKRVASALARYAPSSITVTQNEQEADLRVLHVIGPIDPRTVDSNTVIIQYCYQTAGMPLDEWQNVWRRARLVWSYYDLPFSDRFQFLYAPLGVDEIFVKQIGVEVERHWVLTSGYVSSSNGEAIEEVADAALRAKWAVCHLGPRNVDGMRLRKERTWEAFHNISDDTLADLYNRSQWVSGLRHVEGFELPVIEGAVCGAVPIVFDRPDMHWHKEYAETVPPCHGQELVERLFEIFSQRPKPMSIDLRSAIAHRYDWSIIAPAFWRRAL